MLGIDINGDLIDEARQRHAAISNLSFEVCDLFDLPSLGSFDLVTAARVLQWLADPMAALQKMAQSTRVGGQVVVLDYNHLRIAWEPEPPASVRRFYAAFLAWRAEAGMDNEIADHLGAMLKAVGLIDVVAEPQSEVSRRGDADFDERIGIWAQVADTRGYQIVADGALEETERMTAAADYRTWIASAAQCQTMFLLSVAGTRPVS